jgi:hypothetical protein
VIEDLPLGPTGKVLKRELRTRHAGMFHHSDRDPAGQVSG